MPRTARKISYSSIYHIILRGNNKQIIFEDENDYCMFLDALVHYKEECNYEVLSYCLMTNHIHLLIRFNGDSVSNVVKRIADRYVYRYNHKYDRCGHLFQGRFKSEPVENERYLLTVARYIMQNPIKAGMNCKINYQWSSYNDYNSLSGLADTKPILDLFDSHSEMMAYFNCDNHDFCMENFSFRTDDGEALKTLKKISECDTITEFLKLREPIIEEHIRVCMDCGMSIAQLSRLTGINRKTIANMRKKACAQ